MNIVVIGPGKDPERFGTHFVNHCESEGHHVTKFSYRLFRETPEKITERFAEEISELENIDILLYNCIGGFYPSQDSDFISGSIVNFNSWKEGIMINAAMPHTFTSKSLYKMNENSAIVYMTSSASYLVNRENYLDLVGYFGTKGVMNQLMRAYSKYNNKNAIACCFAPHIPYENPESAKKVMDKITERILNLTKEDNGKILQCYPPGARIWYYEGGKHA